MSIYLQVLASDIQEKYKYHNIEDVWRSLAFNDKKENIKGIGNEFNSNESSSLDDGQKIGDNLEFKSL